MKMRYIPNTLSILRMPFSVALLFLGKLPLWFLICYAIGGILDVLDGIVARRFQWQSELGQKLDSIGDGIFIVCAIIAAVISIELKIALYTWIVFAVLVTIRAVNMVITWVRFRRVGFIHTRSTRWSALPIYALLPVSIYLTYLPNIPLAIFVGMVSVAQLEETWILFAMRPGEYTMALKSYWEWKRDKRRALELEMEPERETVQA